MNMKASQWSAITMCSLCADARDEHARLDTFICRGSPAAAATRLLSSAHGSASQSTSARPPHSPAASHLTSSLIMLPRSIILLSLAHVYRCLLHFCSMECRSWNAAGHGGCFCNRKH